MFGKIALIGVVIFGGTAALVALTYRAISNRQALLQIRTPFPFSKWEESHPDVRPELLKKIIDTIAVGLNVDGKFLRPSDQFENSLALQGAFVIDDDTIEDIAEEIEQQFEISWKNEWKSVGDAVAAIGSQLSERGK